MLMQALDEETTLLSVWQAFSHHVLQSERSRSNINIDGGVFSFILEYSKRDKCAIYSRCGFDGDVFGKLDHLLRSVEQNCLHKIIAEYERFRRVSNSSISPAMKLQDLSFGGNSGGSPLSHRKSPSQSRSLRKLEQACRVKQGKSLTKDFPQPSDSAIDESLGRGKRKKFLKAKFDFVESSNKNSQRHALKKNSQVKDAVDEGEESNNANELKRKESLASVRGKVVKKLYGESKSYDLESSFQVIDCVPKSDPQESNECKSVEIKVDAVAGCQVIDSINGKHNETLDENSLTTRINAEPVPKRLRNFSLDESKGKTVCCLRERVDAGPDECLPAKESGSVNGHKPLGSAGETDTKPSRIISKKTRLYGGRPPGERYNLDCDKLAPIVCSQCRKEFNSLGELSTHWRVKHRQDGQSHRGKIFLCPVCEMSFVAAHTYKLHYRVHSGARPHACSMCSRTFRIYKGLKDHMSVHAEEKTFGCPDCHKMFGSDRLLKQHRKRHQEQPRPHRCEHCGKSFHRRPALRNHLLIHTGEKPHQCSVCSVAFNQKGSLITHMRLHTGDKNFICDKCGRRFNTNIAMITHQRRHTGERPYKCSQCEYRAASSSSLKDHMSVHGTDKPYACQVAHCNRRFKRRSHLISHHKTHAGVKPYKCHSCGASFALTSGLQKHLRSNMCPIGEVKTESDDLGTVESLQSVSMEVQEKNCEVKSENLGVEDHIPISHCLVIGDAEKTVLESQAQPNLDTLPEHRVVIEIVREPGKENTELILSKEEVDAIVRISQEL